MLHYRAFGLTIASEFGLPDLENTAPHTQADVYVLSPKDCPQLRPDNARGHSREFTFGTREGTFHVIGGHTIHVAPRTLEGAAAVVSNMALAICLHQRGLFVLHGAAVDIGGAGVCVIGPSGSGKSTLAAQLALRGHSVLADDTCAIVLETLEVLPSSGRIRLWPDTLAALGQAPGDLQRVFQAGEKRRFEANEIVVGARPIDSICWLAWDDSDESCARASVMSAPRAVAAMMRASHGLRPFAAEHLERASQLALAIPVFSVSAAKTFAALSELAAFVERLPTRDGL